MSKADFRVDENVRQMENKIMLLVEESSALRIPPDPNAIINIPSKYDPAKVSILIELFPVLEKCKNLTQNQLIYINFSH